MIRDESMRGDSGMTRKQITFDLSQDALRQYYGTLTYQRS